MASLIIFSENSTECLILRIHRNGAQRRFISSLYLSLSSIFLQLRALLWMQNNLRLILFLDVNKLSQRFSNILFFELISVHSQLIRCFLNIIERVYACMQTHSFRKISINNNINYIYCMQKLKKVFMLMIQSKSLNTWLVVYLKSMVINILYIKKKKKQY